MDIDVTKLCDRNLGENRKVAFRDILFIKKLWTRWLTSVFLSKEKLNFSMMLLPHIFDIGNKHEDSWSNLAMEEI